MTRRKRPLRTCLGCRKSVEQDRLVRLVLAPNGKILVDYRHRLPGRGAYSCPTRRCFEATIRPGVLGRAFRRSPPEADVDDLLMQVRRQLQLRIDHLIGMARKAGHVIIGSNLVGGALLRKGSLGCVILANDISTGIREKVVRKQGTLPFFEPDWMSKTHLGGLLGRSECSVLGITDDSFVEVLQEEFNRYNNLAGDS